MHKKIGAILLIAGTCIGSGMIALPIVLAKLGLVPSIFLMLAIWFIMYYTSLINLELNLQADQALSLGELGKRFSGRWAQLIGVLSLKILSYSLLAVYIYGGSSILKELCACKLQMQLSLTGVASCYTVGAMLVLLLPIKWIDYFNRLLFIGLLSVVAILIAGLAVSLDWNHLPLLSEQYSKPAVWMALVPVIFTSFGFSVVFPSLTNYCDKNPKMLKTVFFWGSFLPALVYILWTCSILTVVYHHSPTFYHKMVHGNAEVGELIQVLSSIAKWQSVQLLIWWISLLAIITSVVGVGMGLFDSLKNMISKVLPETKGRDVLIAALTVGPAYLAVLYIPNAFITVLGFAGMILALMAVIMPVYLFWKLKAIDLFYTELKRKWLVQCSMLVAFAVIACEVWNML